MAADTEPLEILLHLPLLAEDKVIYILPFALFLVKFSSLLFFGVVAPIEVMNTKGLWLLTFSRVVFFYSFVCIMRLYCSDFRLLWKMESCVCYAHHPL